MIITHKFPTAPLCAWRLESRDVICVSLFDCFNVGDNCSWLASASTHILGHVNPLFILHSNHSWILRDVWHWLSLACMQFSMPYA